MLYNYLKIKIVDTNEISYITQDMLTNNTNLEIQTINNSLKKLEKHGLINIEYNKTSNYELIEAITKQDYDKIYELLKN